MKGRSDVPPASLAKAEQIPEARHSTATYCAREIFFPSAKAISKDNAPGGDEMEFTKTQCRDGGTIEVITGRQNNPFHGIPREVRVFINEKISIETDANGSMRVPYTRLYNSNVFAANNETYIVIFLRRAIR